MRKYGLSILSFLFGLLCLLGLWGNQVSRKFEVDERFAMIGSRKEEQQILLRSNELERQEYLWAAGSVIGFGMGIILIARKYRNTKSQLYA